MIGLILILFKTWLIFRLEGTHTHTYTHFPEGTLDIPLSLFIAIRIMLYFLILGTMSSFLTVGTKSLFLIVGKIPNLFYNLACVLA